MIYSEKEGKKKCKLDDVNFFFFFQKGKEIAEVK